MWVSSSGPPQSGQASGKGASCVQKREVGKASAALMRLSTGTAWVLRDGTPVTMSVFDVVPGDVLVLTRGDRWPLLTFVPS
jgi:magnesium-transporting ATPase (P-type)